jgi:hypothetical protein
VRVAGDSTTQDITDLVATCTSKEEVIDDHMAVMARGAGLDERQYAARRMADIARTSNDMKAVAGALKELNTLLPLDPAFENALDKRIQALIGWGSVAKNAELAEAIALFIYGRAKERASVARPYVPTLLSFLAQKMETTGAYAYYTLMIVASEAPAYFDPHADTLVRMLDSQDYATKIFSMRIIAVLASSHPECVIDARRALRNIAEASPPGIIKAEAAKAYRAFSDIPKAPPGHGSHILDDPAIAGLYEMPVWQRAVESHLSAAYGSDRLVDHPHRRRPGVKRKIHPSKRSNLYQEFVDELKQIDCVQSFEDQTTMLTPETIAQAVPREIEPAEATILSTPPVAEISLPVMNEPDVIAPPHIDDLTDSTGALFLQEMMNEVQNDFSAKAGSLLDSMGMGHMKRGSTFRAEDGDIKADDGNYKISAREFVLAMEKLFRT